MANPDLKPNALQKPPRGQALLARKATRRKTDAAEREAKAIVRKRDKGCRWPGCECRKLKLSLEVAHIVAKSLGGQSTPENMILLCWNKHRGSTSLHSGDRKIVPVFDRMGANGECKFYVGDVLRGFN